MVINVTRVGSMKELNKIKHSKDIDAKITTVYMFGVLGVKKDEENEQIKLVPKEEQVLLHIIYKNKNTNSFLKLFNKTKNSLYILTRNRNGNFIFQSLFNDNLFKKNTDIQEEYLMQIVDLLAKKFDIEYLPNSMKEYLNEITIFGKWSDNGRDTLVISDLALGKVFYSEGDKKDVLDLVKLVRKVASMTFAKNIRDIDI